MTACPMRDELAAGTDPLNSASRLEMGSLASTPAADQMVIRWSQCQQSVLLSLGLDKSLVGIFFPFSNHIPAYPPEKVYTDTLNGEVQKFIALKWNRRPGRNVFRGEADANEFHRRHPRKCLLSCDLSAPVSARRHPSVCQIGSCAVEAGQYLRACSPLYSTAGLHP